MVLLSGQQFRQPTSALLASLYLQTANLRQLLLCQSIVMDAAETGNSPVGLGGYMLGQITQKKFVYDQPRSVRWR